MCYSLDLRKKVISFIENGNSITKVARVFGINRTTVYRWLDKPNLEPIRVVRRKRKIDIARLEQDVAKYPDKTLKQRAQEFGVVPSSIYYQLQQLNIRRKKQFRYRERNHSDRMLYFRTLRELIKKYGRESLVSEVLKGR